MIMFKKFFSGAKNSVPSLAVAIAEGNLIPMQQIPDPIFAQGILGICSGINPSTGFIYSPADGIISDVADSLHAIGITCDNGLELLIHLGIDTVKLKGSGFSCFIKNGQRVKQGQRLMKMNLQLIKEAEYSPMAITCILNADQFPGTHFSKKDYVKVGDPLFL